MDATANSGPSTARNNTGRLLEPLIQVVAPGIRKRKLPGPSVPNENPVRSGDQGQGPSTNIVGNNWRKGCKTLRERCLHMWTNAEKYRWLHDVTFEVGSVEKVKITAHRLILASSCQYFEELFEKNANNTSGEGPCAALPFPQLDPAGFKKTLKYIYSDTIDISSASDPKEIFAILDAAKLFGIGELIAKCYATLRLKITSDNAVELFHLARERNNLHLKGMTCAHISRHITDVFSSDGFLQLSEEKLCTLLNIDNWFLEEILVFEHVKRWSVSKDSNLSAHLQAGQLCGELMRASMGQAFFAIRFPLMSSKEFFQQVLAKTHAGLFSGEEIEAFAKYFYITQRPLRHLQRFVSRPRLQTSAPSVTSTSTLRNEDYDFAAAGSEGRLQDTGFAKVLSSSVPSTICVSTSGQPPVKKVRHETPNSLPLSKEAVYGPTLGLRKYVNRLENRTGKEDIKIINETLFLWKFPNTRLHLPNLSEFRLHLEIKCLFSYGSAAAYKRYIQKKTAKLDRLLFFGPDLESLLCRKVNISLQLDKCIVFSINHKEGSLVLNLVKEAQVIINLLKNFPLKKLAINECQLNSLQPLQRDLLETIVIRRVEGLENRVSFLKGCRSLRKVAWSGFGPESLHLGMDLLFNNAHLEKVRLSVGNFWLPVNPNSSGWQSSLKELYLDMSNATYVSEAAYLKRFPLMYPNLTKVQIYGKKTESLFLYNILKIESLEWICIWETELNREDIYRCGKVQEQNLTKEAKIVHKFLSNVFRSDPTSETNWPTFILQKKNSHGEEQPSRDHVFDPFDASKWSGVKLGEVNMARIMRNMAFGHYSGNQFYPSLKRFP